MDFVQIITGTADENLGKMIFFSDTVNKVFEDDVDVKVRYEFHK